MIALVKWDLGQISALISDKLGTQLTYCMQEMQELHGLVSDATR